MKKAVVLLSSGLDSTINLFAAKKEFSIAAVLTFDYGQRAAIKEIERSRAICKLLNIPSTVVEMSWFKDITRTALVNARETIPQNETVKIDDYERSLETAKAVWVPNRNGVFLNIAAAYAESLKAQYIIPGFNKEEAVTFPDNSLAFLKAVDLSLSYSTANQVETFCYTTNMNKTEIVKMGRELNVPFELLWPCYFNGDQICGSCESCSRFLRALEA